MADVFSQNDIKSNLANIGSKTAPPEDMGTMASLFITSIDTEIATVTLAKTKAPWDTLIKQTGTNRCYQMPIIRQGESMNGEDVFFEYASSGGDVKTKDGGLKLSSSFHVPFKVTKNLMLFDGLECRVFIDRTNNFRIGSSEDATKFIGLRARLAVSSPDWNFEGTPEMPKVTVNFLDNKQDFWDYIEYVKPTAFNLQELDSLTPLDLALSGAALTVVTATVTNTYTGKGKQGLVIADFNIVGAGTLSSLTDNLDGTYTIVTSGLVNGDIIDLDDPADLSISGYYESSGSATVSGIS